MIFDGGSVLAYALGLVAVFVVCMVFAKPLKWIIKLGLNGIMGGLILAAVNWVGGFAGIQVIISPLSSFIAGVLGVPGVILVILMQYFM